MVRNRQCYCVEGGSWHTADNSAFSRPIVNIDPRQDHMQRANQPLEIRPVLYHMLCGLISVVEMQYL